MTSLPLGSTHGQTTSGVACHHRLWTSQTVERRRLWHAIIAIGHHTWWNDIRRGMTSLPLDSTHGRTTSGPLLESTHRQTTLGVVCHHCLWAAHTVERCREWHANVAFGKAQIVNRRRAWHDITALRLHARSYDVGRGMTSPPFECPDSQTTSGVA